MKTKTISSPSGNIQLTLFLNDDRNACYRIWYNDELVIDTSMLGFEFVDEPPILSDLNIVSIYESTYDETWEMPWGEQRYVNNSYNQLKVEFKELKKPNRMMNVVFRVFDEGVGFRYEFPKQDNFKEALILEENTQFNLTGDHICWWQPGDWDI